MSPDPKKHRSWPAKFGRAFRAIALGVRGQSSFYVHGLAAVLVVAAGVLFEVSRTEWCLLALCITIVLAAEMFNSSLERLAAAISDNYDHRIRDALDMASGAVLIAAIGAVVVGAIVFLNRLVAMFG